MKNLFLLLTVLFFITAFTSCSNDVEPDDPRDQIIFDFSPVKIELIFRNSEGVNLLSKSTPGGLHGKDVSIEYDGEVYNAEWVREIPTRYYMPRFHGLEFKDGTSLTSDGLIEDHDFDNLFFGEFDGAKNQDLSFILRIEGYPDEYRIKVNHTVTWKKGETYPDVTNTVTLNGETVTSRYVTITLN